MKRRTLPGYVVPFIGSAAVIAVGLAFCHADKAPELLAMGYANGKDCYIGECQYKPTLTERLLCCADRCPQWVDECVKSALGNNPKAPLLVDVAKAALRVQKGQGTPQQIANDIDLIKITRQSSDPLIRSFADGVAKETPLTGGTP